MMYLAKDVKVCGVRKFSRLWSHEEFAHSIDYLINYEKTREKWVPEIPPSFIQFRGTYLYFCVEKQTKKNIFHCHASNLSLHDREGILTTTRILA